MLPNKIVKNIRYGLATNSSSSHSIIHNPSIAKGTNDTGDDLSYQWDFFTLASKEAKSNYMYAQLANNVGYKERNIICGILQGLGHEKAADELEELAVDHESVMNLPKEAGLSGSTNVDFFEDYKDYLIDNEFIILGGNDNASHEHVLAEKDDHKENYYQKFNHDDIAYRNGNYWVIINKERKLRVNFLDEELVATLPELIDIKITDQCSMGCSFCYQGSTPDSPHASLEDIMKVLNHTQRWKTVVEYAIGGGEPTEHPDFIKILNKIRLNDSIANFTTRATAWFDNQELVNAIRDTVSGIAYSVSTIDDIKKFYELHSIAFEYKDGFEKQPMFYLHLIPEIMGNNDFREMMEYIDTFNTNLKWTKALINVTLLGFKPLGRAEGQEIELLPEIVDIIKLTQHTPVGIDTKFAMDYKPMLEKYNVSEKLYTTEEGQFSMYIDCIEMQAYKSSWHKETAVSCIDPNRRSSQFKSIEKLFKEVNEPAGEVSG